MHLPGEGKETVALGALAHGETARIHYSSNNLELSGLGVSSEIEVLAAQVCTNMKNTGWV